MDHDNIDNYDKIHVLIDFMSMIVILRVCNYYTYFFAIP